MTKQETLACIKDSGLIAIIRSDSPEGLVDAASALYRAGIRAVEISLTTPDALTAVGVLRQDLPEGCLIGVGTVMQAETVASARDAGAQFAVSPTFKESVVRACNTVHMPLACGAYTPTEAWCAYETGADLIKIFPANDLGPRYMKALLAPMPQLPLVPTGGVTLDNCDEYLHAGCVAVAIGTGVVNSQLIKDGNWQEITSRAKAFVAAIQRARHG
ncbi:MAG: bifunctional 4-hydroxy-2-oxoglutarate aldolase/2-dehydro-3-deoxy-phosphogluconate aldolase [Phycisphaerae bacterium]|nr:bifunctional 4-hydroxy-2-oxoglutarate aldolase/2-dehydro-3-deoxy-phosphogluconate aldolase [Phycisphaerae bacterium]